ncbi:MAG: prenyltransferase/squalene oxidase repeat-containing protein [Candidatus Methanofastidiosia archaeon]|jgi:halimadienyl-diphosphate synthase
MQNTILQSTESANNSIKGKMKGVAYDTAWTARITDQSGASVFPECIRWLLENQHPDGSWGSHAVNYHDRIISTLSAIMALKETGKTRYNRCIEQGETYIWENIKNLTQDDYRLIGSELLLPSLMEQSKLMGLNVPYHMKVYEKEKNVKLKKIDKSLWYSPLTTLSFSLEFLGDTVDVERLPYVQLSNGSVANSPAATAFFLKHNKDKKALQYLQEILSLTGNGSVMTVHPIDVFDYGWILYNLMLAGLYFEGYNDTCNFLSDHIGRSGIGCSTESPVADADDTAVVLKVLHAMGYPVDCSVFDEYDTGEYYLTFNFEMDPSVSTNIHILDFVKDYPGFPHREETLEKLVRFLKKEMNPDGFWVDKWHVSPYYPTSHAVIALCEVDQSLAEKAVSWILETQNENGLWGENGGTLEETSYAVQALMYYQKCVEPIDTEKISKAMSVLNIEDGAPILTDPADLWIGKVLYTPTRVVLSSVAGAQFMARGNIKISALSV